MKNPTIVQIPIMVQLYQFSPKTSRNRQLSTPSVQTTGANGTRNVRGASGWVLRRISTPIQTAQNAISVPIETRSPRTSSGKTAASAAIPTPVITVLICGVQYFGGIFANT